jgi:hypothetical protein
LWVHWQPPLDAISNLHLKKLSGKNIYDKVKG